MASSSNVPTMNLTHGEKPEKFNGNEFKRWQQKMLFYLTTLNLARFLHEECPILEEGETNKEKVAAVDAWKHSDFLCRNYVLNGLDNTLYNVYCSLKTAKELWDSLDKKYKIEDAGMKKFIVGKFLDFKMIDSKTVISQVQELQVILHEIHSEGMSLSDSFQVAAVIEKLPPLWKDFKNYLKHKCKEMNLEELIVRLRIEEDNRKSEKKGNNSMEAKANVIEQGPKTNKKRKHGDQNQNQGSNAAKKFKDKCYNCGKTSHKSNDCRKPKKEKKPQANVTEFDKLSNDVSEMNLSAVVSECNIVGNTKEWWVDTGATRHICSNKWMFSTYKPVEQNEELFMDIRKNLVSGSLLSKNGFKLVFVSDKFVLTKNEMFVGKGYLSDGLFKMNVMTVVPKSINNNKIDSSAYLLESSNILACKDETIELFKHYKNEVENQLSKKIKAIRSDRGGEYESPFEEFCLEHGIIHQTTAPYSPQSNGIAERKNRTLKEMMNAMLLSSGLPQNLWGEALLFANYILNKMPHKKTLKTPYELWKGHKPCYKYLKVWGCLAKVEVPKPKKVKIGPKTIDCIFIGYANNSSAYRFLVYKSEIPDVHVNTIIESRNAAFFETIFPYNKPSETSTQKRTHDITFGNNQLEVNQESKEKQVDEDPRRGKRARKSTSFGPDFLTYLLENDPQTFKEAMSSPKASYWKEAINSEIESILQNHTWELVDLPPGTKTLGCKWIFKKKMKADGSIDKYKARLVAKGYKQREGLDYFDTYSPVSRITSIRMLIAIAAINNLEIHQMDVKTAFLNGELDEEIYMDQPEGFIAPGQERKV
ncbi:Retrovirus-related Pol polyprotein from transposon TNT 1-94 [Vitis vinifera]|uniref:Retrovirus-related Pol polyprotein from transposon TNT 1-94 n=1 Tax=Vitis vinifera TaxID=29760 RepID=A0A438GLY3_VITVI|nr:Retrovirus-related Pol polyprotein from transposon TNT 1-94 [Vitis vinifera]